MELKLDTLMERGRKAVGLNRTFMELKLHHHDFGHAEDARLNRTFMELKQETHASLPWSSVRLNRTFMELKHFRKLSIFSRVIVLIAPLWN